MTLGKQAGSARLLPVMLGEVVIDLHSVPSSNPVGVHAIQKPHGGQQPNQDLIASMEEQGPWADASLLTKMGFEVEKRGDKLILKSTSLLPLSVGKYSGGGTSSSVYGK